MCYVKNAQKFACKISLEFTLNLIVKFMCYVISDIENKGGYIMKNYNIDVIDISIDDAIKFYINEIVVKGFSQETIKQYFKILNDFKEYLKEKTKISFVDDIETSHIMYFKLYMMKQLNKTAYVIDKIVYCLKSFFRILTRRGYITINPTLFLEHKKYKKEEIPNTLTYEEIDKISNEAKKEDDVIGACYYSLLTLLSDTGISRASALKLNWEDVDLENKTITIDRNHKIRERKLKMTNKLYDALKHYKELVNPLPHTPLFISKTGNRLSKSSFNRSFRKYVENSLVEYHKILEIDKSRLTLNEKNIIKKKIRITPTTFKNSFIKLISQYGLDLKNIRSVLGLACHSYAEKYKKIFS